MLEISEITGLFYMLMLFMGARPKSSSTPGHPQPAALAVLTCVVLRTSLSWAIRGSLSVDPDHTS